jgi:hypothetical protein
MIILAKSHPFEILRVKSLESIFCTPRYSFHPTNFNAIKILKEMPQKSLVSRSGDILREVNHPKNGRCHSDTPAQRTRRNLLPVRTHDRKVRNDGCPISARFWQKWGFSRPSHNSRRLPSCKSLCPRDSPEGRTSSDRPSSSCVRPISFRDCPFVQARPSRS